MKQNPMPLFCPRILLAAVLAVTIGADAGAQRRDPGDQRPRMEQDGQPGPGGERDRGQRRDRNGGVQQEQRQTPVPRADDRPPRSRRSGQGERPQAQQPQAPKDVTPPARSRTMDRNSRPQRRAQPAEPRRTDRPRVQAPRTPPPRTQSAPRRDVPRARPTRDSRRFYQPAPWRPRAQPSRLRESRRHWRQLSVPHYRSLRGRHYRHSWWCGTGCRLGFLFGFTVWSAALIVREDSDDHWPVWEALEYNATGETSLWESDWGYVEFTPVATYRSNYRVRVPGGYERRSRWCRDFERVVVRNDGLVRRFRGTACRREFRNVWKISRSYLVG